MSNDGSAGMMKGQMAMDGRRTFEYAIVDVFAEHAMEGNALAIFLDGRGLSTEEMQSLARETNLSETTFIVPREAAVERERGVQVRIFTVTEELEFAGHPTLGTATWLYLNYAGVRGMAEVTLDLRVGRIPVRFSPPKPGERGVYATMRQRDPEFGQTHERGALSAALGLSVEDLDPELPPQTVSTGMAFSIVPLRSMEVVVRLRIPQGAAQVYLDRSDAKFFYCLTRAEAGGSAVWRARMQFGNGEDPATGSASGCAIAYLVRQGVVASEAPTVIEQGIEIVRPSRIHVQARLDRGAVTDVFVGGRTIPVATGRFFLP